MYNLKSASPIKKITYFSSINKFNLYCETIEVILEGNRKVKKYKIEFL